MAEAEIAVALGYHAGLLSLGAPAPELRRHLLHRGQWHPPQEIAPLTEEMNDLLEHNETQAEEARRHAGNLAHALKTPLTVITSAASAPDDELPETVRREAATMRRQVDHHLARARAIGRRSSALARADVWPALQSVERAVSRLHDNVTIDLANVQDDRVQVTVQAPQLKEKQAIYNMPKIVPGTYSVSDFGKFVSEFQALDKQGKPLPVERIDTNPEGP